MNTQQTMPFNLMDRDVQQCPYQAYNWLLNNAPVYRDPNTGMVMVTGYDLLREIRADPVLSATRFIMVTAESKTDNVIAAKKAGVDNYIVKPFNAQTLQHKIHSVFPDHPGPPLAA
jgi:CheY-like chemotaxis protein